MLQDPCPLSLVVKWLRLCTSTEGTQVLSLAREFHMPLGQKKNEKTKSLFSMELLKKSRKNRYITSTPVSK